MECVHHGQQLANCIDPPTGLLRIACCYMVNPLYKSVVLRFMITDFCVPICWRRVGAYLVSSRVGCIRLHVTHTTWVVFSKNLYNVKYNLWRTSENLNTMKPIEKTWVTMFNKRLSGPCADDVESRGYQITEYIFCFNFLPDTS